MKLRKDVHKELTKLLGKIEKRLTYSDVIEALIKSSDVMEAIRKYIEERKV